MLKSKVESGSELLARLCQKPSLAQLEPELFPDGVEQKLVVELYGGESSGKTQYLIHVIANAILPQSLNCVRVGGLGVGVVLIDNDYSFNLLRLISLLEIHISAALNGHRRSTDADETEKTRQNECSIPVSNHVFDKDVNNLFDSRNFETRQMTWTQPGGEELPRVAKETADEKDVECCIKDCLKRLYVVHCNSSSQLFITLHGLEAMLANKPEVCLLALDSISTFYWLDKFNGTENNLNLIAELLRKLVETYSLAIFATKDSLCLQNLRKRSREEGSMKEGHKEYLCKAWQTLVSCRIVFTKDSASGLGLNGVNAFRASISGRAQKYFTVNENGIQFINSLESA